MTDDTDRTQRLDASPALRLQLASGIICAYVSHNAVPVAELPGLIAKVADAVMAASVEAPAAVPKPAEPRSAAEIRKSITPDALISFIDGKPFKSLKRHLTAHGYTPETYRAAFGLPADYPMVAATYAAQRSDLAKRIGLGRPGAMAESQSDTRSTPDAGPERIAA